MPKEKKPSKPPETHDPRRPEPESEHPSPPQVPTHPEEHGREAAEADGG